MKYIQTLTICLLLSFAAKAQDTIPPTITLNSPLDTIFIMLGDTYKLENIIVSDDSATEIDLRRTLTVSGTYATSFGGLGPATICGIYTCVYTVEDLAGNDASITRHILVDGDDEVPTIQFRKGNSIVVEEDSDFDPDTIWYKVSDNYFSEDQLTVRITENTVDINEPGTYYLMYEVEDPCGNVLAMMLTVVVVNKPGWCGQTSEIEVALFLSSGKDFVSIELMGRENAITCVQLLSLDGKQQLTQFHDGLLSISQVLDGLYVLVIETESGLITKKLRIQH